MPQALDYEQRSARPLRALMLAATICTVQPLLLLVALYGQWLLSWWMLGHRPIPSLDDPKSIAGASWMHGITFLALFSFVPVGLAVAALNVLYIIYRRPSPAAALLRMLLVVGLWVGTLLLLRWDPGDVLYWWFD